MIRALFTAATGMEAQQTKMDTIANNLANASTTGFKKSRPEFEDLLSETIRAPGLPGLQGNTLPIPLQVGLGVRTSGTTRSFTSGDMVKTDNPTDLAIQGNGFFRVVRPQGDFAYTRAGNLQIDGLGRLTTSRGEQVDPLITVPPDTTQLTIAPDGTVSASVRGQTEAQELGRLELAWFQNPEGLLAAGGTLLLETPASGPAILARPGEQGLGTVDQGFLESSNVKAIEEMVGLISTQRSYELNSKVIQTADQILQRLTSLR